MLTEKSKEGFGLGIIAKYKDKLWEMFRFAINGGVSFLVDYGIMVALVAVSYTHLYVLGYADELDIAV